MLYYDKNILERFSHIINYFHKGIENSKLSHCLLFTGGDILAQCNVALEIARMLNCKESAHSDCQCINCRWIREQTHPAVKIYTRLDFKDVANNEDEDSNSGKKNINAAQARGIISELAVTSDYHRVYIFCDRDEEGNLLPLNSINFPEVTSNALLKTFEEPPANTTFIFLTHSKTDVISTVVSRAQTFFIPSESKYDFEFNIVEDFIKNYWQYPKNDVLNFENRLYELTSEHGAVKIFEQIQNYMHYLMKSNFENKPLFYKLLGDLNNVETAKRQCELTPAMNLSTVCENLSFKLILG